MDLSIIIPAFNEEDFIGDCLASIRRVLADCNIIYEILVVDNGSNDGTSEIASSIPDVTILKISRTSVAQARNCGVEKARGRIYAFIDADVVLKEKWGSRIEKLCKSGKHLFVTGYQYGVRDTPSWIERYWFGSMRSSHISGGNLIASRDAFIEIGGFDPGLKTGEDVDFCEKATLIKGIEYTLDSSFECVHLGYPSTVYQFSKRELWHGEGDFRSLKDFKKSKIAKISIGYGLASCFFVGMLVMQEWRAALLFFSLFLTLNYIIVGLRFGSWWSSASFFNFFINYIYFISRFFSFFRAVKSRGRAY